ncbi:38910_t:CDS:10 [Gigaspora margarita]|uniref:38910_t:CDS:1 n=1 Tax=Gigaspora margarita TaxID=4874 RepID=A0ABN7V119_GIGMA|nr:38910_t:CDS:10 [Gigaspora margarita]
MLTLTNITIQEREDKNLNKYYLIVDKDTDDAYFCFKQALKDDSTYCAWLRDIKKLSAEQALNSNSDSNQSRKEYNDFLVATATTQQWLGQNYPDKKTYSIYINQQLEGELDLSNYDNLHKVSISTQVDVSKLEIKKGSYENHCSDEEGWEYNTKEKKERITELDISKKDLEDSLDLSDFVNLKKLDFNSNKLTNLNLSKCDKLTELYCSNNKLVELDLTGLTKLERISCSNNHLTNIVYPNEAEQLTYLNIKNNNLTEQDLSVFRNLEILDCYYNKLTSLNLSNCDKLRNLGCGNNQLTNLDLVNLNQLKELHCRDNYLTQIPHLPNPEQLKKYLFIDNNNQERIDQDIYNRFFGSLKPLEDLNRLWRLDISNTDIDSGVEYLPESLKKDVYYETELRPNCKLTEIKEELDQYYKEKNIKKADLAWVNENKEEFNHLKGSYKYFGTCKKCKQPNKGGFGYAEYNNSGSDSDAEKSPYANYKTVVLKTLTNSENITKDFLRELTSYKMFKSEVSNMVSCYGISQDPDTKNYIMVMEYMEEGNLREYLQKKSQEKYDEDSVLRLSSLKLHSLKQIAQGLEDIHRKGLVHQDFHSGNIIISENKNKNVFRSRPYTQASDVYSFGMIMYEVFTGCPPYYEQAHDTKLALRIYVDPEKRPTAGEIKAEDEDLVGLFDRTGAGDDLDDSDLEERMKGGFLDEVFNRSDDSDSENRKKDAEFAELFLQQIQESVMFNFRKSLSELYKQYKGKIINPEEIENEEKIMEELYSEFCREKGYKEEEEPDSSDEEGSGKSREEFRKLLFSQQNKKLYPGAVYHSKLINTKQIVQLLQNPDQQQKALELLVKEFIETKKRVAEGKEDEDKIRELKDKLIEEKGLSQEKVDKITLYCDRLITELEKLQLQAQVEIPPKGNN